MFHNFSLIRKQLEVMSSVIEHCIIRSLNGGREFQKQMRLKNEKVHVKYMHFFSHKSHDRSRVVTVLV